MSAARKIALEQLLRARQLQADAPPLRGEDLRSRLLPTGLAALDAVAGGVPRGQLSELHGAASSGRTGVAVTLVAGVTTSGSLAAWVDPGDRWDPASAAAAGVDLGRLLWLRGALSAPRTRTLQQSVAAVGALIASGLFEVVVLDLAGVAADDVRRLPGATWLRLQRTVEETPVALVLVADHHLAHGPGGLSVAFDRNGGRWSGVPGPGRLLRGLSTRVSVGRHAVRAATLDLQAAL